MDKLFLIGTKFPIKKTLRGDAHCGVQCRCRKHCRTFAEQMYGAITCVAGYRKATAAGARMCQGTFFIYVPNTVCQFVSITLDFR